MKRINLVATMSIPILAIAAFAQPSARAPQESLPSVEEQLKVLNEKLDLNPGQQAKIRPIVQRLYDTTEKIMRDPALSHEERLAKVRPERRIADAKIREILTDEQKQKLDRYEAGPHPEMHGTLTGTPSPPAP